MTFDSDDKDFDNVIKHARRKLEMHMESAVQCKSQKVSETKTLFNLVSISQGELCAEKQLGETSCTNEKTES